LRSKVGYEWKNIFKQLLKVDPEETGCVTRQQFDFCCTQCGVTNLSRDELLQLQGLYPGSTAEVDYLAMSKDMNLHWDSFKLKFQ
jgi:hypothetical protein